MVRPIVTETRVHPRSNSRVWCREELPELHTTLAQYMDRFLNPACLKLESLGVEVDWKTSWDAPGGRFPTFGLVLKNL